MNNVNTEDKVEIYVDLNSLGWWAKIVYSNELYININGEVVEWDRWTCYHRSQEACIEAIEKAHIILEKI